MQQYKSRARTIPPRPDRYGIGKFIYMQHVACDHTTQAAAACTQSHSMWTVEPASRGRL